MREALLVLARHPERGRVKTRLAREGLRPIVTATAEVFRGNPVTPARCEARFRSLFAERGGRVGVEGDLYGLRPVLNRVGEPGAR